MSPAPTSAPGCACGGAVHLVCRPFRISTARNPLAPPPYWPKAYTVAVARAEAAALRYTPPAEPVPTLAPCGCRGRTHLVCLPPRRWGALLRPRYAVERRVPCEGCATRTPSRGAHSRACRIVTLATRAHHRNARVTPSSEMRVLRAWLRALREVWGAAA